MWRAGGNAQGFRLFNRDPTSDNHGSILMKRINILDANDFSVTQERNYLTLYAMTETPDIHIYK